VEDYIKMSYKMKSEGVIGSYAFGTDPLDSGLLDRSGYRSIDMQTTGLGYSESKGPSLEASVAGAIH